jgi:O-antigen ligase
VITLITGVFLGYRMMRQEEYVHRGILLGEFPGPPPADAGFGVNVSLEQYAPEDLPRILGLVKDAGFTWVRQRFPWAELEPQAGQYDWARWDLIVQAVRQQGLQITAVVDTSPAWARRPADRDNRLAPPQYVTPYGLFVRALAQRYAGQIAAYQVWDQPNIAPCWGAGNVDPAAYTRLLKLAAAEIRRADPSALVLCAALAPNAEPGGRNLSDVLFLRAMYAADARGSFDVLPSKAYGFWTGPEDRRVDPQVLNLSRLILLREELASQKDRSVPIWAVEFGWNALPADWKGRPSPWGTDDAGKQADRTLRAVQRVRSEWTWLGLVCAPNLQPAVPADDPQWGFSMLRPDSTPTAFYPTWQDAVAMRVQPAVVNLTRHVVTLALLAVLAVVALIALWFLWPRSAWVVWLRQVAALYLAAPEALQWLLLGLLLAAYYWAPRIWLAVPALAVAAWLMSLRLDIGLAYLVFSIPFFLYPRVILGKAFSMVETLTVICVADWCVLQWARARAASGSNSSADYADGSSSSYNGIHLRNLWIDSPFLRVGKHRMGAWLRGLTSLDVATLAFVVLGGLSLFVSANRGVSIREFRVIVLEPALLYFLLRQLRLDRKQLLRLVDALVLAGVAVSLIGLWQYLGHGDVIVTEGVRRMRAVYASPNNLSLLLDRIIPLAVVICVAGRSLRRRAYALALLPLLAGLFLTYSRGGWLLGLPAALLTIGLVRGRRATLVAASVVVVCALLLLPLAGTQRITSLFDTEQGTTFRRIKLWQAAVAMIQDHALTGVGLDNFLYEYPKYMLSEAWEEPFLSHPHNIVLDYWTRLGIGGVAVLVWLVAVFFAVARCLYERLPDGDERAIILGWMACLAAILAHGLIDNSYFLVDLAFIFFLGLGWVRAVEAGDSATAGGLSLRGDSQDEDTTSRRH